MGALELYVGREEVPIFSYLSRRWRNKRASSDILESEEIAGILQSTVYIALANPGFPRGGALTPKGGEVPTYYLAIFPENYMKMRKFWAGGGQEGRTLPLDPPLHWSSGGKGLCILIIWWEQNVISFTEMLSK